MASSLSVKDRMKLFEVGTGPTRPSPRSRMSPRQRLARLSPRGRFGRRGGATKLDQDASDDSLNSAQQGHPFNDTLSRKKAGAVQETETDKTLRETRPSGSSMPPKSPRSRQPASISQVNYDDEIMSAVTNSSNQDYEDKSRAPRSKSPRQPKSPRAFKSSKPSNVHVRFQGDPDINNNKTSNSNHEPSKPEWQIRRVRIMGSKEYESPLSKRKRNMQEAMHEHPFEKNKKAASEVVMWPDDNSDNDDEPDEYRDDLPQGFPFDNENRTPSGRSRPGAIPSIRPSGRDSPRASRRRLARSRSPSPSPTHCMGYDLNKAIEKVSRRNLLPVAVSTPAPAQYVRESPSPACTEAEVSDDEAEEETASSTINTDLEPASALCENNQTGNKLVAPIAVDTDEDGNVTLSPRKKSATLTDPSEQNLGKATNKVEADLKELEAMVKVLEEASPRKKIQVPEEKEERNGIEDTEHAIVDALSAEDDAGLNTPDEADKTEENPEAQVERTIASQSNIAAAKESYPEVSDNQKSRLATLAPTDDQESETMRKEVPSSETKSGVSVNSEGRLSRAARLRNMKAQSPAVQRFTRNKRTPSPEVNNCVMDANALKRNLESASIVMQDEKESSVGSGGSDRSCLSTEELESIASRALNMSRVLSHTKHSKLRNTPLHHLLKQRAKRGRVTAAASRASDPNIEKGKDLKKVNTTAKPIKSFDSESPDKESERQEQNVEEASGSSQIRHENINLVPATGDKHSSMKTNDSFKEPFSHFTVSNRSYKNTRLARRYLHRTYSGEETLSMASGLSAFPQHALRSSPDKTETASSVSKDGSSIPEKPTLTSDMQSSYGKTIKLPPTQGSHQGQNRHQEGFSLFQGARAGIQFCGDIGLGNISTEESFTINESSTNVTDASDSTPPPKSISVISPVQRRQIRQDMPTTSLSREHSESEKVSAGHSKTSFSTNKKVAHANALVALYKQVERQHEEPTSIKEEDSQDCHDVTKDKGPDQTESNKIEAPNDSVSQNKTDGQKATDIFTRSVARRRQHPALVKRTQARNAGRSNKKIQPDEKRMEPDEKRMEEPSRTSHKNSSSIFADKKDIALTYWKYSKAGEGKRQSTFISLVSYIKAEL